VGRIHDALKRAERERAQLQGRGSERPAQSPTESAPPARQATEEGLPPAVPPRAEVAPPAAVVPPGTATPPATASPAAQTTGTRTARLRAMSLEPPVENEYKSLRARIQSLRRNRQIRSLVITSARPGEGKTTTALNLARSYGAEREFDTCLVDLDLRNPDVHRSLSASGGPGPTAVLERLGSCEELCVRVEGSRLYTLAGAAKPDDPSELLESLGMAELVSALHERFGMVIVDSPPVLGLPDATEIVDRFDAVLLVVGANSTTARDIDEVLERIDGEKLIGTVLNRCEVTGRSYAYGYYGGSSAGS